MGAYGNADRAWKGGLNSCTSPYPFSRWESPGRVLTYRILFLNEVIMSCFNFFYFHLYQCYQYISSIFFVWFDCCVYFISPTSSFIHSLSMIIPKYHYRGNSKIGHQYNKQITILLHKNAREAWLRLVIFCYSNTFYKCEKKVLFVCLFVCLFVLFCFALLFF